jgi:DNA repair protein RadC
MPMRLYQGRFDENFSPTTPQDVTPEGFTGLRFPGLLAQVGQDQAVQSTLTGKTGRFVREAKENVQITSPSEAARYLLENIYVPFEQFDQEELWILLLNTKNRVTHEVMAYRGTVNSLNIRVAEIFKEAVRVNATGLILSHCHPSGDPSPSAEDIAVTREAKEAADVLAVALEDHIIVGKDCWVSLRERRLGFDQA